MDLFTAFAIIVAVTWCTMSLSRMASDIDQMERHSRRTADALELIAAAINARRN